MANLFIEWLRRDAQEQADAAKRVVAETEREIVRTGVLRKQAAELLNAAEDRRAQFRRLMGEE